MMKDLLPARDRKPMWVETPEVKRSLHLQRAIKPEDIFGEVQPVKLEGMLVYSAHPR